MRWPSWLASAPSLVAEALREVEDPLAAWLRPGSPAPATEVAAALAQALLPEEAPDSPPDWLRADQRLSFRRSLAAVRRFGGAILADPVGTGKTYVGLATASTLARGEPVLALVPASLRSQWEAAAERTGTPLRLHTHEVLSRGRLPPAAARVVLIDESHRFRNPATRRYRTLAPWLVGRTGLLLTATPAVNGLGDAAHQLLLLVRDDALAGFGLPSLRAAGDSAERPALARLIVTGEDRTGERPARHTRTLRPPEDAEQCRLVRGVDRLRLSAQPAVAALIRMSLLGALASSPAAAGTALRRYRTLLTHAKDARAAGRRIDRASLRRWVAGAEDQLVMWALLPDAGSTGELALDDLALLDELIAGADAWGERGDTRSAALAAILARQVRPTLVFTTARATVTHLRRMLPGAVAWCTGSASGIGPQRLDRGAVLGWFRRNGAEPRAGGPRVLVATDVAAEGLDLARIERVVHFDLPWTQVRLTQREGRALRLGASHRAVEVVRLGNAPWLEARLTREARILAKAGLPVTLGIGDGADSAWRQSIRLADSWRGQPTRDGVAAVTGELPGAVVGYRIHGPAGQTWSTVRARAEESWTGNLQIIAALLEQSRSGISRAPAPASVRTTLDQLANEIRRALRAAHGLGGASSEGNAQRLRRRLLDQARRAARRRDRRTLEQIDRGLAWLGRGRTAGEEALVAQRAGLEDRRLLASLRSLPPAPPAGAPVAVSIIGVLLVEPVGDETVGGPSSAASE